MIYLSPCCNTDRWSFPTESNMATRSNDQAGWQQILTLSKPSYLGNKLVNAPELSIIRYYTIYVLFLYLLSDDKVLYLGPLMVPLLMRTWDAVKSCGRSHCKWTIKCIFVILGDKFTVHLCFHYKLSCLGNVLKLGISLKICLIQRRINPLELWVPTGPPYMFTPNHFDQSPWH